MDSWSVTQSQGKSLEVTGHLGFCKFITWSLSVRYIPFVYELKSNCYFF